MELDEQKRQLVELTVAFQRAPDDRIAKRIVEILQTQEGSILQIAKWLALQDDLSTYNPKFLLDLASRFPTPFLIINGGLNFQYPLWRNLDPAEGVLNPTPFTWGGDARIPYEDHTFDLVVVNLIDEVQSVHLIEEAKRVLKLSGAILISTSRSSSDEKNVPAKEHLASGWLQFLAGMGLLPLSSDAKRIAERFNFVPRIHKASNERELYLAVREKAAPK